MQVILLERVEKLGQIGDVVTVKPGYARNYLLPQKKALRATKGNIEHFETQRSDIEARNLERRKEAEAVAAKLGDFSVVLIRQAGESGQLYGSVSARDLVNAMAEKGFNVERNQIRMDRAIKALGMHPVRIVLHPEVEVAVTANVARSEDEAETQAKTGRMVTAEEAREVAEAAEAEVEAVVAEQEANETAAEAAADEGGPDESEADEEASPKP